MADLPRIFASPSIPFSGPQAQTTAHDYGAGAFHTLAEVAADLAGKQRPIDLDRLKSEYDLEFDDFKRNMATEPDTDTWESEAMVFEKDLRARKLNETADPMTQAALKTAIDKDYARNIIDVRIAAAKTKTGQQIAYADNQEFVLSREVALEPDPAKKAELTGRYMGIINALASGPRPSLAPDDAEKRRLRFAEKVDEQGLLVEAENRPLDVADKLQSGQFNNADPIAKERALNIAERVVTARDRRENQANKARADIAERVYRDQAENKQLDEAQFDAAARWYKFDQATIDGIKKMQYGIKMPSPHGEKLIVDAMEPVNRVDVTLPLIEQANRNMTDLVGRGLVDSTTPEFRQNMSRLRFLKDILTPGTPASQERQARGDGRRRLAQLMMQYDLRSETELRGQLLGQIETMPVGSIPSFLSQLEQQWKARQAQSLQQLQGIQGLRSLGEKK